jgi:4-carboxymuconolactone decarboxylase
MSDRPETPRLAPAVAAELDGPAQELLSGATRPGSPATNIFATLVRHPGLFRRWLPFGGKLLAGKLPARDRELLILRVAWRCRSEYEWGQHVLIGTVAGLTKDEILRIRDADTTDWDDRDGVLVRAADELHDDSCISDETWRALAARYDERQLIEVPMLVGHYHMVAFALNTLGVQREPGVPGFDE